MKLQSFQDLKVWQLSSACSKDISQLIKTFPRAERFELADDLLRAARSVPANISEGWGRLFPKEKISSYNISYGSAEECSNHLIEALNNGYIDNETNSKYQKRIHVISVKLTNLIISTRKRINSSVPQGRVSSLQKQP
ncbi:MAG: four helix bundle protein [Anaerolineales bacterium]|nr:four helix bundle protein [Anaerolineales bacterium]